MSTGLDSKHLKLLKQIYGDVFEDDVILEAMTKFDRLEDVVEHLMQMTNANPGEGAFVESDNEDEDELDESEFEVENPGNNGRSEVEPVSSGPHRCGYCGVNPLGSHTYGMISTKLTVADYQKLVERNWSRSGTYMYRPVNNRPEACCPQYNIRLDVNDFKITKSQKSVLRKMEKYLNGELDSADKSAVNTRTDQAAASGSSNRTQLNDLFPPDLLPFVKSLEEKLQSIIPQLKRELLLEDNVELPVLLRPPPARSSKASVCGTNMGIIAYNLLSRRSNSDTQASQKFKSSGDVAKLVVSLLTTLIDADSVKMDCTTSGHINFSFSGVSSTTKRPALETKTPARDLPESAKESEKHTLTMEVVKANFTPEIFALYKKYQIVVHKDKPQELSESRFKNHLVANPFQAEPSGAEAPSCGCGAFFMLYRLDGKLIAVSAVDILPSYFVSAYFFYDPSYKFLSLGVYSTLREIEWVQQEAIKLPQFKYYHMGFYVHACPKMKYKGNYKPSMLLCPVTYRWVPLATCVPLLEKSKYCAFSQELPLETTDDVNRVRKRVQISAYGNVLRVSELIEPAQQQLAPLLKQFIENVGEDFAISAVVLVG